MFGKKDSAAVEEAVWRYATAAIERAVASSLADKKGLNARLDREMESQLSALQKAIEHVPDAPFAALTRRAALTPAESGLLALLITSEQSEHLQQLIVSLTDDRERHRVELGMLARMVGAGPELAAPSAGLLRAALVELGPRGSFGRTQLKVAPRVVWALRGDSTPDPRLDTRLVTLTAPVQQEQWASFIVTGEDRTRRRQLAVQIMGSGTCIAVKPPQSDEGWAALVREATIGGYGVVLETDESVSADGRRWIERSTHLSWALSSATRLPLEELPQRDWRELEASTSDPDQEEWNFVLGRPIERQHHLTATQLDMMAMAMTVTGGDPAAAYRRLTDARLDKLARHTVPRAGWDDLVLSTARKGRLRDLVNRYRSSSVVYDEWGYRPSPSRGLVALFSGPSGTGKTMAAEIVAGELGLDLYRLDLSTVVSKYIGETEKNLDELFDAASIGTTVLFFDEADALFSKRSDVHDSKDRYANVETSYLLQRLERYDGIVVMATNYEKNIDQAFLRRVHVRIDFPQPLESERRELWERMLKSSAPQADDINLDWLAKNFDVTGSSIRNAILDSAFLAAAQHEPIGMAHLARGMARELQKLGRIVTEKQFGAWYAAATTTTDQ